MRLIRTGRASARELDPLSVRIVWARRKVGAPSRAPSVSERFTMHEDPSLTVGALLGASNLSSAIVCDRLADSLTGSLACG
jgi:hypothetical protein